MRCTIFQLTSPCKNRCFPCGMVVDKEIIAKICSLIRGIEREGYSSSWLVGGCRATQGAVTTAVRKACCCVVALAGWHSGQGSRVCNSTTISSVQEPCSTLAGVGHFGHRFSAFWLSHFAALTCGVPQGEALSVSEEKLFRPLPVWRYLQWIMILVWFPELG